jgi:hypothetical protein
VATERLYDSCRDGAGKGACSAQVAMGSVYGIEDDLTIQPLSDRNAASALTARIWGRFFGPPPMRRPPLGPLACGLRDIQGRVPAPPRGTHDHHHVVRVRG